MQVAQARDHDPEAKQAYRSASNRLPVSTILATARSRLRYRRLPGNTVLLTSSDIDAGWDDFTLICLGLRASRLAFLWAIAVPSVTTR